jgi:hypothetical protein
LLELWEHYAGAKNEALKDCTTDSASACWNHIPETVLQASFGWKEGREADWFLAGAAELERLSTLSKQPYSPKRRIPAQQHLLHSTQHGSTHRRSPGVVPMTTNTTFAMTSSSLRILAL